MNSLTFVDLAGDAPPPEAEPGEVILLILIAAVAGFFWIRNRVRVSDAREKARSLSPRQVDVVERSILARLHGERDLTSQVRYLAQSIDEHPEFVIEICRRLLTLGHLRLENQGQSDQGEAVGELNEYSRLTLTLDGDRRLKERDPVVHYHGDFIHTGDNAQVVNRSIISNSYNDFSARYSPEVVEALDRLEQIVRADGDPDAIETLEGLLEEAASPRPSRARMRALFAGIQQTVPTLAGMVDVVTKVSTIFA